LGESFDKRENTAVARLEGAGMSYQIGDVYTISTKKLSGSFCVIGKSEQLGVLALLETCYEFRKIGNENFHVPKVSALTPFNYPISELAELNEKQLKKLELLLPPITKKYPNELLGVSLDNGPKKYKSQLTDQCDKTDALQKRFEKSKQILSVLSDPQKILRALKRGDWTEYVKESAYECGLNRRELRRHLSRFAECGWNVIAASMFYAYGAATVRSGDRKETEGVFLGPPSLPADEDGTELAPRVRVSTKILHLVGLTLASLKNKKKMSIAAMHAKYKEHTKTKLELPDGSIAAKVDLTLHISYSQFYYAKQRLETKKESDISYFGKIQFLNNKQPLIGTARHQVLFPGQCYIIDSTVVDMHAVCSFDRSLLAGRPNLYVVIDAFSSLIVGLHLSYEPPSAEQARIALYRAVAPKEELFKELGIEWLLPFFRQGVVPTDVFADRGELLSKSGLQLAEIADISMTYAAPYRASWKSLVERVFGLFNDQFFKWSPGGIRGPRARGDKPNELDAIYTINEILRCLFIEAARMNCTRDMNKYATASLIRERIPANPLGFWDYGLKHLHGSPRCLTRTEAAMNYLTPTNVNVRRNGCIKPAFDGEPSYRFTAEWMRGDNDFYALDGASHCIRIDPDLPGHAYVQIGDSGSVRQVSMAATLAHFNDAQSDLSHDELRIYEVLIARFSRNAKRDVEALNQGATFDANIEQITNAAKAATAEATDKTTVSKKARNSKRFNRRMEKRFADSPNTVSDEVPQKDQPVASTVAPSATIMKGGSDEQYMEFMRTLNLDV
jgi:hypothetical protein